jgi:hypothetical protein
MTIASSGGNRLPTSGGPPERGWGAPLSCRLPGIPGCAITAETEEKKLMPLDNKALREVVGLLHPASREFVELVAAPAMKMMVVAFSRPLIEGSKRREVQPHQPLFFDQAIHIPIHRSHINRGGVLLSLSHNIVDAQRSIDAFKNAPDRFPL